MSRNRNDGAWEGSLERLIVERELRLLKLELRAGHTLRRLRDIGWKRRSHRLGELRLGGVERGLRAGDARACCLNGCLAGGDVGRQRRRKEFVVGGTSRLEARLG